MPTLLLVGVGMTGRPYATAARRLGLRLHVVESAARAAALAGVADHVEVCAGSADEDWVAAAQRAAEVRRPDGVVAFSEPHVLAAALLQDRFGLPGPSLRAAVISRNKALQRATFAAAGVGQPEHRLVADLAAARDWALERLPVVVKPLSGAGSAGVELVADAAGYDEAGRRRAAETPLLVERAVPGPEFSWEALVVDGRPWLTNLTAKETTGPPYFVEVAHRVPAAVGDDVRATAETLGTDVLAAIGMRTGLVHLEFRFGPDGPAVMEFAVRTPGDHLMDLLRLAYGVDWFELVVAAAVGRPLPAPPPAPVGFAASFFPVAVPGTVRAVAGLEEARSRAGVEDAGFDVAPGQVVGAARSSAGRAGHVVLSAPDAAARDALLAAVRRDLVVTTA